MPAELPYLPSYKNVAKLFNSIKTAKVPDAFTNKFLTETLGITGSADRPLIPLLRTLGFLDAANKPTNQYARLKNPSLAKKAIAEAVRKAYAPLFAANENAHTLSGDALKGLVAQVAGTDAGTTQKIAGTFNALVQLGDFSPQLESEPEGTPTLPTEPSPPLSLPGTTLRPEFHYNIQIHLPANGSEETYLNIFNALRKAFK